MPLLRSKLVKYQLKTSQQLRRTPDGCVVRTAGIVTLRQQPPTARGTVFVTLENEHGVTQVIVWKDVREAQRQVLLGRGGWRLKGSSRERFAI